MEQKFQAEGIGSAERQGKREREREHVHTSFPEIGREALERFKVLELL